MEVFHDKVAGWSFVWRFPKVETHHITHKMNQVHELYVEKWENIYNKLHFPKKFVCSQTLIYRVMYEDGTEMDWR